MKNKEIPKKILKMELALKEAKKKQREKEKKHKEKYQIKLGKMLDKIVKVELNLNVSEKELASEILPFLLRITETAVETTPTVKEKITGTCPKCGADIIERKNKEGRLYRCCVHSKWNPNRTQESCHFFEYLDD